MSGESVFELVRAGGGGVGDGTTNTAAAASADAATMLQRSGNYTPHLRDVAPPPTASTFGIHGTSAIVANVAGECTEASAHPAKKATGTFGREVGARVDPATFLKKNQGTLTASRGAALVDGTRFKKSERDRARRKCDVPSRDDKPVMGLCSDKNYVVCNAVEAALALPPTSAPTVEPRATDRADFAQVPRYLQDIKAEMQRHRALVTTHDASVRSAQERWSQMTADELHELRAGLQRRWDALNSEYQTKGVSKLQTPLQKVRYEALERDLCAIEVAQQKLARAHVFVYDDQK